MTSAARREPRMVVIVGFPGVQSLDVAGPWEVFAGATAALAARGRVGYRVELVSAMAGEVVTESGMRLGTGALPPADRRIDTLLLPGGRGVDRARHDERTVSWVAAAAKRSRRVVTVCSGTFLGAAAGLLDGRTVTTHWARAEQLAREHPALVVDARAIYLHDGRIWTSAGVTAGIDLALALVEADHGAEVARTVARWLVMFPHRPGGQQQFAAVRRAERADHVTVRAAQALVEADPGADHRITVLAATAAMSARHFTRVFSEHVGEPPGRYVERVRLQAAQRDLETTAHTLDVIARRSGLGTPETLRRVFHRRLGVAPDAYRRRFSTA